LIELQWIIDFGVKYETKSIYWLIKIIMMLWNLVPTINELVENDYSDVFEMNVIYNIFLYCY